MRSVAALLAGLLLVAGGIAVLAAGPPGGVPLGVALLVAGIGLKVGGIVLGDATPPTHGSGRVARTLGGRAVERPRAGVPTGRAAVRGDGPASARLRVVPGAGAHRSRPASPPAGRRRAS